MDTNKIKEQFHYFNIHADVDSVYGNWVVSTGGNVVNCLYPYAMHFKDTDWMEKMESKVRFKPEYMTDTCPLSQLVDGRNIYDRQELEEHGFVYTRIGEK